MGTLIISFLQALPAAYRPTAPAGKPIVSGYGSEQRTTAQTTSCLLRTEALSARLLTHRQQFSNWRQKMDRKGNPSTNPDYEHIAVLHKRYGRPEFWHNARAVLAFAMDVDRHLQTFKNVSLDRLVAAKTIAANTNSSRSEVDFRRQLQDFTMFCYQSDIFNTLRVLKEKGDVRLAIGALGQQLTPYDKSSPIGHALHDYDSIIAGLTTIIEDLTTLSSFKGRLGNVEAPLEDLLSTVTNVAIRTTSVTNYAANLIGVIATVIGEDE